MVIGMFQICIDRPCQKKLKFKNVIGLDVVAKKLITHFSLKISSSYNLMYCSVSILILQEQLLKVTRAIT